jgi:transcriptional antiterminator
MWRKNMGKYIISKTLSNNVVLNIALLDHINFAIKRLKEGIEIINPFLYEIAIIDKEY